MSLPRKRNILALTKDQDGKRRKISPELPEELIREKILPQLPFKSVVRFKSVCKSWRSLFCSPQFVKQHNAGLNPNDYDCLVADNIGHTVTFSRYQQTCELRAHQSDYLIGSASGLVCISCENTFTLWNPAIHQYKRIHLPPLVYIGLKRVGFGYDPVTNDYKVAVCYGTSSSHLWYAVYSSNSYSWIHHQFDVVDYKILTCKFAQSRTPDTMVNDCPYWTSTGYTILAALKFDATINKFKFLPEFHSDFSSQIIFKVVNMRSLLTLMAYDPCTTGKLDIYSLDEDMGRDGVWRKMSRLGPIECVGGFRHLQQGFIYGDEIVIHDENGNIYRYDHKTKTSECIPVTESRFNVCFTYTPSLAFLEGMTST